MVVVRGPMKTWQDDNGILYVDIEQFLLADEIATLLRL